MFSLLARAAAGPDPAADAQRLVAQYEAHWKSLESEVQQVAQEHGETEKALEPAAAALRAAQNALAAQQRTLSEVQAAGAHLRSVAAMKEEASQKLAAQVERERAGVAAVEAEAAADRERFLQAADQLHAELSDIRASATA